MIYRVIYVTRGGSDWLCDPRRSISVECNFCKVEVKRVYGRRAFSFSVFRYIHTHTHTHSFQRVISIPSRKFSHENSSWQLPSIFVTKKWLIASSVITRATIYHAKFYYIKYCITKHREKFSHTNTIYTSCECKTQVSEKKSSMLMQIKKKVSCVSVALTREQ